jgi:excisionase family DNA binding protein
MDQLLLTPEEAFAVINVGRAYGYRLIREGVIPSLKIGRLRRIPADALNEWVNSKLEEAIGSDHSAEKDAPDC